MDYNELDMASVTTIHQKTHIEPGSNKSGAMLRDSVRMRTRQQLAKLSTDFFDAADDYLFAGGGNASFADNSIYFNAMRELRTKQNLFDEAFIDIAAAMLFLLPNDSEAAGADSSRHLVDRHAEVFEMLEIDLALQAMRRKAEKLYASFNQPLDALSTRFQFLSGNNTPFRFALTHATLWSFGEAQRVFALPLDIRLIVIKLFEQHFLLKLESVYVDAIATMKQVIATLDLNQSRGAAAVLNTAQNAGGALPPLSIAEASGSTDSNPGSRAIDQAVDDAVTRLCAVPGTPAVIVDMIPTKWRSVLFLIGLNRGCAGYDWQEAMVAAQILVFCAAGQRMISPAGLTELLEKLRKGLGLVQMPESEQEKLLQQVGKSLRERIADGIETAGSVDSASRVTATSPLIPTLISTTEASISPAGKKILNQDDLDEIADLLGGDSGSMDQADSNIEKELLDCLPDIDFLQKEIAIEYKIDGSFQTCALQKNVSKPGMFNITDRHAKTTITRSRLGLAISLHAGELKLPGTGNALHATQKTLIDPPLLKPAI